MSASFITPGHVPAYQAVTSRIYGETSLMSCRINGEPGVAIVLTDMVGEGKMAVMPLFVALTESMQLEFVDEAGSSSGGGRRPTSAKQEVTQPACDIA